MSKLVCVSCGGDLIETGKLETYECDSCGVKQSTPKLNNNEDWLQYNRGMEYLRNREYDEAKTLFEKLLESDAADAQILWSLVMCKYGVEYVEDPKTKNKVITLNRTQTRSIFDDVNYKLALEYSDVSQKILYEHEAEIIEKIQLRTFEISKNEQAFDIFISYKESDDVTGARTLDSYKASDLYELLTNMGYKVFFSRVTLNSNAGKEYEPFIFSALQSSKIMLLVGGSVAHIEATWVKNEWSRFLNLMSEDKLKEKHLIPLYFGIRPEELPRELAQLHALDMDRAVFYTELKENVTKILSLTSAFEAPPSIVENVSAEKNVSAENQFFRGENSLKAGNFSQARDFFEKALDYNAKEVKYYWASYLANNQARSIDELLAVDSINRIYSRLYQKNLELETDRLRPIFDAQNEIMTILSYSEKDSEYQKNADIVYDKIVDVHTTRQKVDVEYRNIYAKFQEREQEANNEKQVIVDNIRELEKELSKNNGVIQAENAEIDKLHIPPTFVDMLKSQIINILLWPWTVFKYFKGINKPIWGYLVLFTVIVSFREAYFPGLILSALFFAVISIKPAMTRTKLLKLSSTSNRFIEGYEKENQEISNKINKLLPKLEEVDENITELIAKRDQTFSEVLAPLNGLRLYSK